MNCIIVNATTGNSTVYTQAELRKLAVQCVKGKGKLESYWVEFIESTKIAKLVAQWRRPDGWGATESICI